MPRASVVDVIAALDTDAEGNDARESIDLGMPEAMAVANARAIVGESRAVTRAVSGVRPGAMSPRVPCTKVVLNITDVLNISLAITLFHVS